MIVLRKCKCHWSVAAEHAVRGITLLDTLIILLKYYMYYNGIDGLQM